MSMFDDMYIPWTPYLGLKKPKPPAPPPTPAPAAAPPSPAPQVCTRTLHIARVVISHAVQPFPEVGRAISDAFIADIKGDIVLNLTGDPWSWSVVQGVP